MNTPTQQQVIQAVCNEFCITVEQLSANNVKSKTHIFFAKAVTTYLLRRVYDNTTNKEVMNVLGYRAKTFTPLRHNIKAVEDAISTGNGFIEKSLCNINSALLKLDPPIKTDWGSFKGMIEMGKLPKV